MNNRTPFINGTVNNLIIISLLVLLILVGIIL